MDPRDIAIRTILGEAANESDMGQAAVAHVLLNRARDPRWPSTIQDVALQNKQFSAWNKGAGGNHLVNKYSPGDGPYERAAAVYDNVATGQVADPTGGATHYYAPAGMQALVNQGAQSNLIPRWLQEENARRGGQTKTIGGHTFTGQAQGSGENLSFGLPPTQTGSMGTNTPFSFEGLGDAMTQEPTIQEKFAGLGKALMEQQAPQQPVAKIQPQPMQAQGYQPMRRDTIAPYMQLFQSLRG